jgi:hypothetical protein
MAGQLAPNPSCRSRAAASRTSVRRSPDRREKFAKNLLRRRPIAVKVPVEPMRLLARHHVLRFDWIDRLAEVENRRDGLVDLQAEDRLLTRTTVGVDAGRL